MIHPPLGSRLLRSCYPTCPAAIGLFVFPDGLTDNFDHFIAGLEENLQTTNFSRSGVGELATTTMRRRQPFSATTRSSPMGSLTRCSRARRKLPGPSAIV